MTYAKRFQFSLAELLLLSMWAGAAVLLAVPYRLYGPFWYHSGQYPAPLGEMTFAAAATLGLSAVAGALGLWRANKLESKGLRRAAGLSAYQLGAWLLLVFVLLPPLTSSRLASNENYMLHACKTYAEAQNLYRRSDWDNDGVLEYAQDLQELAAARSKPGADALLPAGFAAAEVPTGPPSGGTPYHGYVFKVLTGQGPHAPGGAFSYIEPGEDPAQLPGTGVPRELAGTPLRPEASHRG